LHDRTLRIAAASSASEDGDFKPLAELLAGRTVSPALPVGSTPPPSPAPVASASAPPSETREEDTTPLSVKLIVDETAMRVSLQLTPA
jgi:hypothetical protein